MSMSISRATLAVSLVALWAAASTAFAATPVLPVAPIKPVDETLHGVVVKDPYRYFENVKTPEVQSWLTGQAEVARDHLDRIDARPSAAAHQ